MPDASHPTRAELRAIMADGFTCWTRRADAEEVCRRNTADETEGWRYKVAARPSGFVVEVTDADGVYVGAL